MVNIFEWQAFELPGTLVGPSSLANEAGSHPPSMQSISNDSKLFDALQIGRRNFLGSRKWWQPCAVHNGQLLG